MIFYRFFVPLAIVLGLLAYLLLPFANKLFLNWSENDLEIRSSLVFNTISDELNNDLSAERVSHINKKFADLVKDERLIGIGLCQNIGSPKYKNKSFPMEITCPYENFSANKPLFKKVAIQGGPVLVATFPLSNQEKNNVKPHYLMIIHDMAYAEKRSENTQHLILWFLLAVSVLASAITLIIARLTLSRMLTGLRDYVRTGIRPMHVPREAINITREIHKKVRQLEREQQLPQLMSAEWSSVSLYEFIRNNLPSEQIISVSYRQPYIHTQTEAGLEWSVPASGLVTAIEPIMKACKGTWIAAASSEADRLAADSNGSLMLPPNEPSYRLKRIWLSEEDETGFYAGFANEGLWPLCSMVYVKPRFRATDWMAYQAVNRKFAESIISEAKTPNPIIFIQDYHFGLLPKLVRDKLPGALIIVFWHIPWPNSEVLSILPWREEFINGLLAADIIGFHTQFFCNNFIDSVDTHIESLIDREHDTIRHGQDLCMVRPYPISIAWPDYDALGVPTTEICRKKIINQLNLMSDAKIVVGVERLDYIKGIPERLRAFGNFLAANPEWKNKVHFVQIASPSRSILPAYAEIGREVESISAEINALYGNEQWTPIYILKQNFDQKDVCIFYRCADVCVVSSLQDGMNLVAKEFVAARNDNKGVLVLSQFSGSSRELIDAIIVNPYDEFGLAESIKQALELPVDEITTRMKSMRDHVRRHNVFAWAAQVLGDAAKLHQRRQLNNILQKQMNKTDSDDTFFAE